MIPLTERPISNYSQTQLFLGVEFPGGPVVRTPCFHCEGRGSAKKKKKEYTFVKILEPRVEDEAPLEQQN